MSLMSLTKARTCCIQRGEVRPVRLEEERRVHQVERKLDGIQR